MVYRLQELGYEHHAQAVISLNPDGGVALIFGSHNLPLAEVMSLTSTPGGRHRRDFTRKCAGQRVS